MQFIRKQPVKWNLFFLITHQVISNFANIFAYLKWHGQGCFKTGQGCFKTLYFFIIFWQFFCKHFYYIIGFFNFCYFFADSKSIAQELSNDVSYVIFGHQTWDLVKLGAPPQRILVFKYPSRDRVKERKMSITSQIVI